MNKYDEKRKNSFIGALLKAKMWGEVNALYLTANDRPKEEIYAVEDALEHITIALEHLGVKEEAAECPHGGNWDDCPDCRH